MASQEAWKSSNGPLPPTEPTIGAFEFKTVIAQVGLGDYEGLLRENGFWGWENVKSITEYDMAEMDFKLGARWKLQRVILEYTTTSTLELGVATRSPKEPTAPKRQYRRHPRPDMNAPIRPKSAYVLFGEQVRQDPTLSAFSFTDLAKETGKRWKEISEDEKERTWNAPAAKKLLEYKSQLEAYKRTRDYQRYQEYLDDFKQVQNDSDDRSTLSSTPNPKHTVEFPPQRDTPMQLSAQPPSNSPETNNHDTAQHAQDMDVDNEGDEALHLQSEEASGPVKAGLEEVHRISKSLGINSHLVRVAPFPKEAATAKSVKTFLRCTGALVYLWSYEQGSRQVQALYHSPSELTPINSVEVFAMAAVGSYCDGHPDTRAFANDFLEYFVVASARNLMLSALDIGREAFKSQSFITKTSQEELRHWWNVFRGVVFLESWFAYNTHQESRVTHEDLNLYTLPQLQTYTPSERYQGHLMELGRLATYGALDVKSTAHQPKASHAHQYLESLTQWHRTLPPPMQLSRISLADPLSLDWYTKRSLFQLHIVFLGLFIEPYRRCLIDLGKFRLGDKPTSQDHVETMISVEEQCVSAARQSARVASLMSFDNLVRAHCWILVYTSYVGCTVLLYSAAQQLQQGIRNDIGLELAYASSHISVLSVCSYENEAAKSLFVSLQILFNDVRDVLTLPMHTASSGVNAPMMDSSLGQDPVLMDAENVSKCVEDISRRSLEMLEESIHF